MLETENIFSGLLTNPTYYNSVVAYLTPDLFEGADRDIIKKIKQYSSEYNKQPTFADVRLLLKNDMNLTEGETKEALSVLTEAKKLEPIEGELLFKETEKYAQEKAFENTLKKAVDLVLNENAFKKENITKGSLPDLFRDALSISFTTSLGHDYFRDVLKRYDFYTNEEELIKCGIEIIDELLKGGFRRKTMSAFLGRTNIGKTLVLCALASALLKRGYNVLYLSGEMAEEGIAQRIDANTLNIEMDELAVGLDKKAFLGKLRKAMKNIHGRLKIKEYPEGTCNALHVKSLLQEYKLKDGFVPDIVIFDYINLFSSYRLPSSAIANTYLYVKTVTEEMRGLAKEFNFAGVSATQTNRGGSKAGSDTDMTDTADSFGLPMALDYFIAIIQNDELFKAGKYLFKVLKSRYGENINEIYTIGVARKFMRLFDLAKDEQELPKHIKDQLNWENKKDKERKNAEAAEDLKFEFNEEETATINFD